MNLALLLSETRNPDTVDLDMLSTLDLVTRLNQQHGGYLRPALQG